VTVDDLKEMGLEVGPRHKAANHIAQWIEAKAGNHHGTVALLGMAPDGTDGPDMQSWLEKRSLSEHLALFGKHKARRVVDDDAPRNSPPHTHPHIYIYISPRRPRPTPHMPRMHPPLHHPPPPHPALRRHRWTSTSSPRCRTTT